MNNNIPVFCTESPTLLGGILNTPNEIKKIKAQAIKSRKNPKLIHKIDSIYFHRDLEKILGYDIVNFIDGEIPYLEHESITPCLTITPDNKKIESAIVSIRKKEKVYSYIVIPEDIEASLKDLKQEYFVIWKK